MLMDLQQGTLLKGYETTICPFETIEEACCSTPMRPVIAQNKRSYKNYNEPREFSPAYLASLRNSILHDASNVGDWKVDVLLPEVLFDAAVVVVV